MYFRLLEAGRKLCVGKVEDLAKYTLVDEKNYYPVVRQIFFKVYENPAAVGAGNFTNPVLWGIIMIASVFAAAMAITFTRRKE